MPQSKLRIAEQVTTCGRSMVIEHVVFAVAPVESFTWMLNVPAEVGVPVIAPVVLLKLRPAGGAIEKV